MKTVKITIEVKVSDFATHVAVDADGCIYEYGCAPKERECYTCWDTRDERDRVGLISDVINWKNTLTEVE